MADVPRPKLHDMAKFVAIAALVILAANVIWVDIRRGSQVDALISQNDRIIQQLGTTSTYPSYGDMQFPKIAETSTRAELKQMLGVYRQIAVEAVKKREEEIADARRMASK